MSTPRPTLHYSPPSGWVNDPLALTFHDGRYHLFFQYVAGRTTWDVACTWGHATSPDLHTWETQPVALEVGDGEDGVWSGSIADDVLFYTAVDAGNADQGRVRRALPDQPSWTTWRKEDVVLGPPVDGSALAFRDPYVTAYQGGWRMLLAGGLPDGAGALWSSRSEDLVAWSPPVLAASGTDVGPLWECPALLEVDGRPVLVLSVGGPGDQHAVVYAWVESDDGDRLGLGPFQQLTYGPSVYAASGFADADGRPGLISWLRNVGDADAGWMGAHSLPWVLSATGDRLLARPHPTLDQRRAGQASTGVLPLVADVAWAPRPGDVLEAAGLFRAQVAQDHVMIAGHVLPWSGEPLRMVLDGPVLEVFGDGGVLAVPVLASGRDSVIEGDLERVTVTRLV
ncbi:MAG: glycoside hydrolase family 32 protein [Nocardioides sp.]